MDDLNLDLDLALALDLRLDLDLRYIGASLDAVLWDLHQLAQAEDVHRGRFPTNWHSKWVEQLGIAVARSVATSIDESASLNHMRPIAGQS